MSGITKKHETTSNDSPASDAGDTVEDSSQCSRVASPTVATARIPNDDDSLTQVTSSSCASTTANDNTCPHCGGTFNGPQGVRVHISRSHQAISQAMKLQRRKGKSRTTADATGNALPSVSSFTPPPPTTTADIRVATRQTNIQMPNPEFANNWKGQFEPLLLTDTLDEGKFDELTDTFSQELVQSLQVLPGPKHPATKFYEKRKQGRPPERGQGYSTTSNPSRTRKERSRCAKERYEYDLTQFEYYNRRKKAWQRVRKNGSSGRCKVAKELVEEHFRSLLSSENKATRDSYGHAPPAATVSACFTDQDIANAMKGIDPGTAPGVDRVLLRPIKELRCAPVIAIIASIMLKFGYVPKVYREGRTVLIHKGGDETDIGNFRPITIFPIIRRIIERAIDKRIRNTVSFCSAQRGFVSTPGTYINASVVNTVLQSAKKDKKDAVVVFLDVRKAFDNVGHCHLAASLDSSPLPGDVKKLVMQLMTRNTTQVEVNRQKTRKIEVNRGVPQGAPLSPTMFNLSVDFLIKELVEKEIAETYGYNVNEVAGIVSCIAFADDIAILARDWKSARILVDLVVNGLREIGLDINCRKSTVINIVKGKLSGTTNAAHAHEWQETIDGIPKLQQGERVRYLGIDFSDEISMDKTAVLEVLQSTLNELTCSPLLKPDQKLNIINQFIWPSLVYPLQCAPLKQLTHEFLEDVDIAIRGAVKEILQIPMDTPNDMIYSPRKFRGLGIVRASWEAFLQHFNICSKLAALQDDFLQATRDFQGEIKDCLSELDFSSEAPEPAHAKELRKVLRRRAYDSWCCMPVKGQGAVQFQEHPPSNKWIVDKQGLSSSQWTNAIKMTTNCAAVRGIKGRCGDTSSCRHSEVCRKTETLCHVLQDCPQGELLRNNRHHNIRDILEEHLKAQGLTVYREVRCTDTEGRERRADLVVIDRHGTTTEDLAPSRPKGYILDPTIRFETTPNQALEVDAEKKRIYVPTIPYFRRSYGVEDWEVIGLYVGSRGTITKFLVEALKRFQLPSTIFREISTAALRHSLGILHHHLYSPTR